MITMIVMIVTLTEPYLSALSLFIYSIFLAIFIAGDYPEEWKTWGQWHDGAKSAKGFSTSAPAKRDDSSSTVNGEGVSQYLVQSGTAPPSGGAEMPPVSNMPALQAAYDMMYTNRIRIS